MSDDFDQFTDSIGATDEEKKALRKGVTDTSKVSQLHIYDDADSDLDLTPDDLDKHLEDVDGVLDDDLMEMGDALDDLGVQDQDSDNANNPGDTGPYANSAEDYAGVGFSDDGSSTFEEADSGDSDEFDAAAFDRKKRLIFSGLAAVATVVIGVVGFLMYESVQPPEPRRPTIASKQAMPPPPKKQPTGEAVRDAAPQLSLSKDSDATQAVSKSAQQQDAAVPVSPQTPELPPVERVTTLQQPETRQSSDVQSYTSTGQRAIPSEKPPISPLLESQYNALSEELSAVVDELNSLKQSSRSTDAAVTKLETLNRTTQRNFDSLFRQLESLQQSIGSLAATQQTASESKESITRDRIRLGNFNIIKIDEARTVHAHSPANKRITLVEGEQVKIGPDAFAVRRVIKDQNLALIGDRWYIDVHRAKMGAEERALRREPQPAPLADTNQNLIQTATDNGRLSLSTVYEVRAITDKIAYLRHCDSKSEQIYRIGQELSGHGRIRAIHADEVISDRSVFRFNSCQ